MAFKRLISLVFLILMLATSISPIALAEVGDVDYKNDNFQKTESDGEATVNDSKKDSHWWEEIGNYIGDAFNKGREFLAPLFDTVGDMGDVISDRWNKLMNFASDKWGELSSLSQELWASFTDWSANLWDGFIDGAVNGWNALTNFTSNLWDATPNWVKSTISFVGVGAGIVGGVALGIISAPVAIAAGIGAGIAGGAYYLMNRNSDYSFLGSLGWTAGGALLGGIGQATGALAAAGRGLLSLGKSAWGQLKLSYTASGTLSKITNGVSVGVRISTMMSLTNSIITGEFNHSHLLIDIVAGGLVTGLMAPISLFAGGLLSAGKFGQYAAWGVPIATFGGIENFMVEGLKGEWLFTENFVAGFVGGMFTYGVFSNVSNKFFNSRRVLSWLGNPSSTEMLEELTGKGTEDIVKKEVKDGFNNSDSGKSSEKSSEQQKKSQKPDQPTDNSRERELLNSNYRNPIHPIHK
ncbi:hypothetical protein [Guptibacillus algicola]|uniref:hypothetical protein n=1 Tax=Guptibacillus algicola TaxID=225844 RepID=UPI001CD3353F|nr:hypothetical protein [Alkalihalobacillus algicola]MCA0989594.1 hypothetical protein [Alkalihalobacillus algicola]